MAKGSSHPTIRPPFDDIRSLRALGASKHRIPVESGTTIPDHQDEPDRRSWRSYSGFANEGEATWIGGIASPLDVCPATAALEVITALACLQPSF